MSIEAMNQAFEVSLVEQLESVPTNARLVIDDADGMGTQYIPVGRMCHDASKALRQAIAEAEQEQGEPVAWVIWFCGYPAGFFEKETDAIKAFEQRNLDYPEESRKLLPLYTTPQQRTWVGLTDEEAEAIWEDHQFNGRPSEVSFANRMNLMQAIEAKLKEKNT